MHPNPKYVEKWINYLDDVDREMSLIAAEKLGRMGDTTAVPALIKALRNRPNDIRAAAARALGDIRDPRAITPLAELLEDHDTPVAYAAADALGRIGDNRAVPALRDTLIRHRKAKGTDYLKWRDNSLFLAVCSALRVIGTKEALEVLKNYGTQN